MGLADRLRGFLVGWDEAFNALGGGSPRETISGTVGRALQQGDWWAPLAAFLIEVQPWFGRDHCLAQAVKEASRAPTDVR